MAEPCHIQKCDKPAEAFLGRRSFCGKHFITACYADLKGLADQLQQERFRDESRESVKRFLQECFQQASVVLQKAHDLESAEQTRLIEILFWSSELGRSLRRSPRKVESIPVRLRCYRPGAAWEEETHTLMVSRYGALIACQHPVEVGETLSVVRLDTGQQAPARVAWVLRRGPGRMQIGVEFHENENFWEVDWQTVEAAESS